MYSSDPSTLLRISSLPGLSHINLSNLTELDWSLRVSLFIKLFRLVSSSSVKAADALFALVSKGLWSHSRASAMCYDELHRLGAGSSLLDGVKRKSLLDDASRCRLLYSFLLSKPGIAKRLRKFHVGELVDATWVNGSVAQHGLSHFPARVLQCNRDGTYKLEYEDGGVDEKVKSSEIRKRVNNNGKKKRWKKKKIDSPSVASSESESFLNTSQDFPLLTLPDAISVVASEDDEEDNDDDFESDYNYNSSPNAISIVRGSGSVAAKNKKSHLKSPEIDLFWPREQKRNSNQKQKRIPVVKAKGTKPQRENKSKRKKGQQQNSTISADRQARLKIQALEKELQELHSVHASLLSATLQFSDKEISQREKKTPQKLNQNSATRRHSSGRSATGISSASRLGSAGRRRGGGGKKSFHATTSTRSENVTIWQKRSAFYAALNSQLKRQIFGFRQKAAVREEVIEMCDNVLNECITTIERLTTSTTGKNSNLSELLHMCTSLQKSLQSVRRDAARGNEQALHVSNRTHSFFSDAMKREEEAPLIGLLDMKKLSHLEENTTKVASQLLNLLPRLQRCAAATPHLAQTTGVARRVAEDVSTLSNQVHKLALSLGAVGAVIPGEFNSVPRDYNTSAATMEPLDVTITRTIEAALPPSPALDSCLLLVQKELKARDTAFKATYNTLQKEVEAIRSVRKLEAVISQRFLVNLQEENKKSEIALSESAAKPLLEISKSYEAYMKAKEEGNVGLCLQRFLATFETYKDEISDAAQAIHRCVIETGKKAVRIRNEYDKERGLLLEKVSDAQVEHEPMSVGLTEEQQMCDFAKKNAVSDAE